MRTISRFETESPSLMEAYRQADHDQRRRAALAMCLFAIEQAGLQSREVDDALALLRRDVPGSSDMQQKLDRLAAELDERFQAQRRYREYHTRSICDVPESEGGSGAGVRAVAEWRPTS